MGNGTRPSSELFDQVGIRPGVLSNHECVGVAPELLFPFVFPTTRMSMSPPPTDHLSLSNCQTLYLSILSLPWLPFTGQTASNFGLISRSKGAYNIQG